MKTEQKISIALAIILTLVLCAYNSSRLNECNNLEKRIAEMEQSVYKSELTWELAQDRILELYTVYESIAHSIDTIKEVTIVRERLKALNDLETRVAALEKSGTVTDTISFNDLESDTLTSEYFSIQRPIRIRIVSREE